MPPITPEQLAEASRRLEKITQQLEEKAFEDICRRIAKAAKVTDTAEYQLLRLKEMGYANEFIEKTVAEYTAKSESEIRQLFYEAAQASEDFYAGYYEKTGKEHTPLAENEYMQQLISASVEQTHGEIVNLTQSMGFAVRQADGTTAFKPIAKTYQSALDLAQMQVASGIFDYNTAIRNAVISLSESGLQFVDYASGHRNRADVAVRRAVLTGLSQMTGQISKSNAEELETDIVEVTAHAGARPDHAEWQGRRYSLSGKSKEYPSLAEATGYGTGDGLKGWNCRHDFYAVIPELSPPAYTEEQLANIDPPPIEYNGKTLTYYECTQKQRAMETAMRKTKREVMGAKAVGDDDLFTAKSILLRRQKEEYAKFSDKAGLLTQNERTQVYGFDKSISAKAAWAVKKAQSASGGSSAPSGGKAVTVNVPAPASSGKAYTGEKIVKPLDNGGGSGIIKSNVKSNFIEHSQHKNDFGVIQTYTSEEIKAELFKSEAGRRAIEHIDNKAIYVEFDYNPLCPSGKKGYYFCGSIHVYMANASDLEDVAKTVIHEATHSMIDSAENSMREEFYCRIQEYYHTKKILTIDNLLDIAREIKSTYGDTGMKWREPNGYKRRGYNKEN